ncbi:CAP domain-containing protein [Catenuloplanes sp. NPDC051500]|uniref:CAP domain-containing protein n=1 Tax=Catenuloplanes sp. NPDC051500 TaxID=3363959 RepID=UPI0037B858D4
MRNLVRSAALTAVAAVIVIGGTATAATAAVTPATTLETQVVAQTNVERVKAGCTALTVAPALTEAARAHSTDMATFGYFSHTGRSGSTFTQRVAAAGYAKAVGENIAWGYADAAGVMTGWMNSPGHRANILTCKATTIGVGVARDAQGTLYWTQEFGA